MENGQKKFIPQSLYKNILKNIPIVCVDVVIVRGNKFLLGKRVNEPAKGEWWVPGGRVLKNETLKKAAARKIKEEVGIKINQPDLKYLMTGEIFFKATSRHMIGVVFLVRINKHQVKQINFGDYQHSQIAWFDKINKNWHPYLKILLKTAGFK